MLRVLLIFLAFLISSCGSLTVSPRGCKSTGYVSNENLVLDKMVEQNYWVFFNDQEVLLKELVNCKSISTMKLELDSIFFFQYKVRISFKDEK